MFKKFLCAAVSILMLLSLAGCNSDIVKIGENKEYEISTTTSANIYIEKKSENKKLAKLINLTELTLSSYDDYVIDLEYIATLPNLEKLTLGEGEFVNLERLGDLPNLKHLVISETRLDDYDFLKNINICFSCA